MEPATKPKRLWLMPHDGARANGQLRKAEVETFPILRSPGGRMRKVVKGKTRAVSEQDARRIARLVIPPAWRDVRISADPRSHIQAVGRDEAGRRQYIYHQEWEAVRSAEKAERLRRLIGALPRIRRTIARDLDHPGDRRILATAARLVDRLCLRAGHEEYAGEESGRGAATLLSKHVRVVQDLVEFDFPGKGKRRVVASLTDLKVARNIEEARKLRGRRLFKLRSGEKYRNMTANDLNAYLARIAKCDISAKDFRTLRASSLAIASLALNRGKTSAARRRILAKTCRDISEVLSNTPAVVRKSYIHSPLMAGYEKGALAMANTPTPAKGRRQGERLLLAFLREQ
jgi:DNA topoisomerase-1